MNRLALVICFIAVGLASFFCFIYSTQREASILFVNGTVYTLDAHNTVAEAVAVSGGNISRIGSSKELLEKYRAQTVIDLQGKTIMPGFVDAHVHVALGLGKLMRLVSLYGMTSSDEIVRLVKERAISTQTGRYIVGRGWDQNLWDVKEFPNAAMLDKVVNDHPVVLIRVDGHAIWVNNKAMQNAGVTRDTKDPPGGKIIRDSNGNPTGVFLDDARDLVENVMPPDTPEEIQQNILSALHECMKLGLTEVHDMGIDAEELAIYQQLAEQDKLPIRVYAAISVPGNAWNSWMKRPPLIASGNGMLTVRSVKLYVDGALGSRGAALIEEYRDDPGNRGITMVSEKELEQTIHEIVTNGYQPAIHAIGDRANHMVLNAYEKVLSGLPAGDYRCRIEHAQVIDVNDIPRFKRLNVLPSMQPVHATSDMYWAEARVGKERIQGSYAWKSLLTNGSIIVGGSDAPNDALNPLWGFYAASTRSDRNGYPQEGWMREQKMTREEAARSFTQWASYSSFEEHMKGTIEPGKWADLTILSKDIMKVPALEILTTEVEMTIVGGKIVYSK